MFDKFFNHIKNTCSQKEKPTHHFIINWTIETSVSEVRYTFLFLNNLSMKLVKFWLCLIYLQIFPPPLFSYFPFSTYSPFFFLIVFSFSFSYVSHTPFFFFLHHLQRGRQQLHIPSDVMLVSWPWQWPTLFLLLESWVWSIPC